MDTKRVLLQWFIKFLIKSPLHLEFKSVFAVKNENMSKQKLAEELHKTVLEKLKKRKVYSSFIDNIWGVDLVDIQLISKLNKGIRY